MAPLPSNNTPRFKVHYTNAGVTHTMLIRSADSPLAVGLNIDDFLTPLGSILAPTTVDLVEFSAAGSLVFNSVTTGIEGSGYGSGVASAVTPAAYAHFIGRSSDGRRVRIAVFGITNIGTDFRYGPGELGQIDGALASLNAPANHWLTIGGIEPVWKAYANSGFNAYWQKQIRP